MSITLTNADTSTMIFVPNGFTAGGMKFIDQASSLATYVHALFVRHTEATPKSPKARRNLRLETSKVVDGITETFSVDLTVNANASKWTADEIQDRLTAISSYFNDENAVALFMAGGIRQ